MLKVGLIYSSLVSDWKSVESITKNLRQSYDYLSNSFQIIDYNFPYDASTTDTLQLANKILENRPDNLIFLDHFPNPGTLIQALHMLEFEYAPQIFIHIYGNFTFCADNWYQLRNTLTKRDISFIFASVTEMRLFQNFTLQTDNCYVYPFPVCSKSFYQCNEMREEYRKKISCIDGDFIIVYSGRLSLQKNVTLMAKTFAEYALNNPDKKLKLFLAGFCDDLGSPFHNIKQKLGHQHYLWKKVLSYIPEIIRSNIVWLGNLKQSELLKLYNAADCYLSFSLHHDEDYGMAPREALFCGTPNILTNWGGFSDLKIWPECNIIDLVFNNDGIIINTEQFHTYLDSLYKNRSSLSRKKISEKYTNLFSPENTFNDLYKIIHIPPKRFLGFNYKLIAFKDEDFTKTGKNSFYKNIYSEYT